MPPSDTPQSSPLSAGPEAQSISALGASVREVRLRMWVSIGALCLLAVAVTIRLVQVQVVEAGEYQKRAKRQYEYRLSVKANRGEISDRKGQRLATTVTTLSFAADPGVIEHKDDVAALFAEVFDKPKEVYAKKLREKTRFVWLERHVPMSQAEKIIKEKYYGILDIKEQSRRYENIAPQVIGFLDSDGNGISGLEKQFQHELSGKDGVLMMQRTATGHAFPAIGGAHQESINGNSLTLTLDSEIQAMMEDELKRGVLASGASAAIGILMDVRNADILAMANYPTFDANQKGTYTPERTRNRAVTDVFEPGSTFKLVTLSAATEKGLASPEEIINGENGKWKIRDQVITDHEKLGAVTLKEAIMKSSNIISAKLALRLGNEAFYNIAHNFGFGQRTEVGLLGEIPGQLKPLSQWSGITLAWMAHGYEVLVTPIQLLNAYVTLASGGEFRKPRMVKEIRNPNGEVIYTESTKPLRRVISERTAKEVAQYFKAVVDSGTGTSARVIGLPVAGKTGTAQLLTNGSYRSGRYVASFVGFFPADQPEFAALIMMIEPTKGYYGGMAAAPVFSKVATRLLSGASDEFRERALAGIALDASKERHFLDTVKTVVVPNVKGLTLKEAKLVLRSHRLDFSKMGNDDGIVQNQLTPSGSRVPVWSKISLMLSGGDDDTKVTSFIGLSATRALKLAGERGLAVSLHGGSGKVIAQSIRPGDPKPKQGTLILTLSQ